MSTKILNLAEIGDPEPSGEDNDEYGSIDVEALLDRYEDDDIEAVQAQGLTQNPVTAGEDEEIDLRDALKEYVANVNAVVEFSREVDAVPIIGESVNDIGLTVEPGSVHDSRRLHSDFHNHEGQEGDQSLQQEIFEEALGDDFEELHREYNFEGHERVEEEQDIREFVIEYFDETNEDFDIKDGKYSVNEVNGFSIVSGSAHSEYWSEESYSDEELDTIWENKEEGRRSYFDGQGLFGELRDTYDSVSETIQDATGALQGVFSEVDRFLNGDETEEESEDSEESSEPEEERSEEDEQSARERPEDWGVEEIEEWISQPLRESKREERMDILDLPEWHRKKIRKQEELKRLIRDEASGSVMLFDGGLPKTESPNFILDMEDGEHKGSFELQQIRDEEGLGRKIATYVGSYTEGYGQQSKDNAEYVNTHGTVTEIEVNEDGRRVDHQQLGFFKSDEEDGNELKNKGEWIEREEEQLDLWEDLEDEYDEEFSRSYYLQIARQQGWGSSAVESIEENYREDDDYSLDDAKSQLESISNNSFR